MSINLGDRVKHQITGFAGIAVARTLWLNGCERITVQPETLKDGATREHETFDIEELVLVKAAAIGSGKRDIGGPRPEPKRREVVG